MTKPIELVKSDLVDIIGKELGLGQLFIHSTWKGKFTPDSYKIGLMIVESLRNWAKETGFTKIVTNAPKHNVKAQKYCEMFGFYPTVLKKRGAETFVVYEMEI